MNNTERVFLHTLPRWSGVTVITIGESLSDMWLRGERAGHHSALQYDPEGISRLRKELRRDFDVVPSTGAFVSGGKIQTVDDLGDAMASSNQKPLLQAATTLSLALPRDEVKALKAKGESVPSPIPSASKGKGK